MSVSGVDELLRLRRKATVEPNVLTRLRYAQDYVKALEAAVAAQPSKWQAQERRPQAQPGAQGADKAE